MAGAQRSDTTLTAADLRRAYLQHTHPAGSNLSRAALQEANLRHADPLSHADLRGANLTGAVLDGTAQTGAHADNNTIWAATLDAERRHQAGILEDGHDDPTQPQPPRA